MRVYPILRSVLFKLDPELVHHLTLNLVRLSGEIKPINQYLERSFIGKDHPTQVFGLNFTNPIGLAAGYDKDGNGWKGLASLGFGHIEVGTVTPKAQPGNPKPRIFRLSEDQALINRMGFPGLGADYVLRHISRPRPKNLVLGVNIGKNKDTPLENAVEDYLALLRLFHDKADYLTINVSSPNTVGLRRLQEREYLQQLLKELTVESDRLAQTSAHKVPILLKLAPDLTDTELDEALDVILANHMEGVIATNTTLKRDGLVSEQKDQAGGLSGRPLMPISLEMVRKINQRTNGKLPVIGVGGISTANDVKKFLDAGAVLVQLYTGLVYEGPGLVRKLLQEL